MHPETRHHRTYERYNKARVEAFACHNSCHRRKRRTKGRFKDFPSREELGIDEPGDLFDQFNGRKRPRKRSTWQPPPLRPYHHTQASFRVRQLHGKSMREIRIIEHLNQDFSSHATEWELRFSPLARGDRRGRREGRYTAIPVVDGSNMVVGYMMTVNGQRIYVPTAQKRGNSLQRHLDVGVPAYVDDTNCSGWSAVSFSQHIYTVLVSVDGEVVEVLDRDTVGVESVDAWILDAITVGGVVVTLGKTLAKRASRAVVRKTADKPRTRTLTGRTARKARQPAGRTARRFRPQRGYIAQSGMPRRHFEATQAAAQETGLIGIVRNTNVKSTRLIEQGAVPKPLPIKANTSPTTGVVTTKTKEEVQAAWRAGFYVIDADGIARRQVRKGGKIVTEELPIRKPFWKVEKGQIIQGGPNPKPLAGDYDLMGVVDPQAAGRNAALVAKDGKQVSDVMGPEADRFRRAVNSRLDQPRIMHGAQDQFAGFRGGATVFYPDGRTLLLRNAKDVEDFYKSIGRATRKGSYNPNIASKPAPPDELAARRKQRR